MQLADGTGLSTVVGDVHVVDAGLRAATRQRQTALLKRSHSVDDNRRLERQHTLETISRGAVDRGG